MTTTIYIVTPSFNAIETIDRTIHSVVSQAGDFRIRYHVQDGGSTDGTVERLEWWKQRLKSNNFPLQCHGIRLTYASESDHGMYDALVRGFSGLNAVADDFMTWINADDILMPGALAFASVLARQFTKEQLSWFGGAVCVIRDDLVTSCFDRPVPREAIRLGLCDGIHWDYLQQEGTFFRKWLWNSVNPAVSISGMKLAGDWNLWRLMSSKAGFAQFAYPLGGFRISENQLSARQREGYLAEIEAIVGMDDRRNAMERFCDAGPVKRRKIKNIRSIRFRIVDESVDRYAQHRYFEVFRKYAPWSQREQPPEKIIFEGTEITSRPPRSAEQIFPDIEASVLRTSGMFAFNADWQFPAVTEKHAFERLSSNHLSGMIYVAYPWATLIDKVQNKAPDADIHLDRFEQFCDLLPRDIPKITVCQHIHGRAHTHLFHQAGITDVFWSHATHQDVAMVADASDGIRFHPFPLYPVQVPEALPEAAPEADDSPRKYLFSFIGARANQYYLTEARNWILDLLKDDPRGLIVGRDSWHYQKVVYDLQIKGVASESQTPVLVDSSASDQFRDSLLQSTFSLCPAGSGPNSIRLWESLGAGTIPVILADTWAPPGNPRLWEMAAVSCRETPEDIRALPDRLAAIAAEPGRLAQMRHAMRQLWILYGPQGFVTDVQEFILSHAAAGADPAGASEISAAEDQIGRALATGNGPGLLCHCAAALLLEPAATLGRIAADPDLAGGIEKARAGLAADAALLRHYDAVLKHATGRAAPAAPARPALSRGKPPKICFLGRHSNRTPLSYAPIRRLIGDRLETVETPAEADLVVTGFNIDLRENIDALLPALRSQRPPRIAILSEEPLWDITWSGPFTGREGRLSVGGTAIDYTFLGHETSDIYAFERIPYFVLTSDTYAVRYANLMGRFRGITAGTLLQRWRDATVPAAFFVEYRKGDAYSGSFPERDVTALSAYRSEVAERTVLPGVLRVGKGWDSAARRQDLPDWHLDKLAQVDGRTRVLGAFENVHQRLYISEKIFDAFAAGAIPAYWAGPKHRIFELVPEEAMLNCHGLDAAGAAGRIAGFTPDITLAEAWLTTCTRLASLFGDSRAIRDERARVARVTLDAVLQLA